ncbi:MAG TPA: hypothetical protein VJ732_02255, partial [Bryobacteraceae bacterium]|nr:hypothetical protein [Bryobacteraceae bacterium]
YATPAAGNTTAAIAQFELQGNPAANDFIELAWLDQHFNYQIASGDTLDQAAAALAGIIDANQATGRVAATASGARITLTYLGAPGANGNRIGVYGTVHGAGTGSWSPPAALFSGGSSPERWRVDLDFSNLRDRNGALVPTGNVRKMRWTWAADLQPAGFQRTEFSVVVASWTVSGANLEYRVAGPGSRRIEDDAPEIAYAGSWNEERGNYSGGSIRRTATPGAHIVCCYFQPEAHALYLGARRLAGGADITVTVDGGTPLPFRLQLADEDVLTRLPLGQYGPGPHTVTMAHNGAAGTSFYFDFLEIALPSPSLPSFEESSILTLATDWDTDHSLALAPERTAWLMDTLGFRGRANHYAGALWFYELSRPGHVYASATVHFAGAPEWSKTTELTLGSTPFQHLGLIGDTPETIAKCLELLVNAGSTGVWAQASGATLTLTARVMGAAGNAITLSVNTNSSQFTAQASGPVLAGGIDGAWRTDLAALPRLNRAARDWNRSFLGALHAAGIEAAVSFSMELQHGDDSAGAGIAQRYPNGDACWLNTPALQTNFGPASLAFWKQVYLEMAGLMQEAGIVPYLQFGEVEWWYFASGSGMPFYDDYTKARFQSFYGRPMAVIPSQHADPADFADECALLPALIGEFTDAIMTFVRAAHPQARFEVLYPPDVNDTPLNRIINFPIASWTAARLECLKTENFTYTAALDLNKIEESIELPLALGFARSHGSHLVGIGEYTTPWEKEQGLAAGAGLESVVLFALDQFCLIGYGLPLGTGSRRSLFMGG